MELRKSNIYIIEEREWINLIKSSNSMLNPVFRTTYMQEDVLTKSTSKMQIDVTPEQRVLRSDKQKDIKIPVTRVEQTLFRQMLRKAKLKNPDQSQTKFNTELLVKSINHVKMNPEQYPPVEYKDTHLYMTFKPTAIVFVQIEELQDYWNMSSIRSTLHRIMYSIIHGGVAK